MKFCVLLHSRSLPESSEVSFLKYRKIKSKFIDHEEIIGHIFLFTLGIWTI